MTQTGIFNYDNPVARLRESDGKNNSQNTRITSNISYNPIEDLKLSALFSYNQYNQNRGYSETKSHVSALRDGRNGYASIGSVRSVDKLMELTSQYSKNINRHKFSLLGGYSYQDNSFSDSFMQNWDFPTDKFSYNIVRDPVHVRDLQATLLYLFGIQHERFTFRYHTNFGYQSIKVNQKSCSIKQGEEILVLIFS